MCQNTGWKSVMLTTPVDTHPAEWHDVESVATAIDFIKEITVGEMRCVVYLQLTAGVPEGPKEIIFKNFYNTTGHGTAHKRDNPAETLKQSFTVDRVTQRLLKLTFPLLNVS